MSNSGSGLKDAGTGWIQASDKKSNRLKNLSAIGSSAVVVFYIINFIGKIGSIPTRSKTTITLPHKD